VGLDLGELAREAGELAAIGFLGRTFAAMLVGEGANVPDGVARIDVALVRGVLATVGAAGAFGTPHGFGHEGIGRRLE
jgi:hypothetical protein